VPRYRHLLQVGVAACWGCSFLLARVEASSTSPAQIIQRVLQLIQQGDLAEARGQLAQALREFPKEAGFYDLLGVVEAQERNYRAAETDFTRAIELDPRLTGAYLNLGHLYQENSARDPDALRKGLGVYERLLRFQPNNTEANYQSALLLERRGSFQASLNRLSRLAPPDHDRAQALAVRCADFVGLGDRNQTDAAAGRLLSSSDLTEADILLTLPQLEAHRRSDLEVRLLEGLAGRQLASLNALHTLALLYERRGQLGKARDTLEKVAKGQPDSAPALIELARVADHQRDYTGALGYLAHARDLEPQNAGIHFFFGMVCVEENLALEAYNSLKQAVTLEPQNPYYNYAMGAVAVGRDDPREALPYFKKYCELKPHDPRGRFALGAAYFYSRDYESADKELRGVAGYRETTSGAHYFLGRIANQEGRLREAASELQQALKYNPKYADALAELGHVRLSQKEYALAEQALLHALEIDPDNYMANLNLMVLYQRTRDSRAEAQTQKFDEVKKKRAERAKEFLRTIEVRP
jgi:tetratricopeptide (TPR) repeat protein